MPWRLVTLSLAALLAAATLAPASAVADDNPRRAMYQKYDLNGDKRIKGKEARAFRKERPKVFANLVEWCEDAKARPKKHDVKLPADQKPKKTKCRKGRIDAPYMRAWVRAAADTGASDKASKPPPRRKGGIKRGGTKGGVKR